jgi:hypothetical protein
MAHTEKVSRALKKILALPGILAPGSKERPLAELSERELIQLESEIGRDLFGPVPRGHRREFFNTDPRVWIWYEEWRDEAGRQQQMTIKYEIRDDGVWKALPGLRYEKVEGAELANFRTAVGVYFERVMRDIYKRDPKTGKRLQ